MTSLAMPTVVSLMWYSHDGTVRRTVRRVNTMSGSGILNMFNISDTTPDPTPDRTSCEHDTDRTVYRTVWQIMQISSITQRAYFHW